MLTALRRVLSFEMTVAEWIGTAALLAVPYLVIGVLWALTHTGSVLGSIAFWPAHVVSVVCLA